MGQLGHFVRARDYLRPHQGRSDIVENLLSRYLAKGNFELVFDENKYAIKIQSKLFGLNQGPQT